MWYKREDELDYSKPTKAVKDQCTHLLLPVTEQDSYRVIGYKWFNVKKGKWNSSYIWATPQEAIQYYCSYKITNTEVILT